MKKIVLWIGLFFFLFIPKVSAYSYYQDDDGNYLLCEEYGPGNTNPNCISVNLNTAGVRFDFQNGIITYNGVDYYFNDFLQSNYNDSKNGTTRMYFYVQNNLFVLCEDDQNCNSYTLDDLIKMGATVTNNVSIVLRSGNGPGYSLITYYFNKEKQDQVNNGGENEGNNPVPSKPQTTPSTDTCTRLKEPLMFLGHVVLVVKILIPIVLIAFGMIDFFRAMVGSKDDEIKKSARSLAMRVASGAVIFFIPTLVSLVFSWISSFGEIKGDFDACQKCIFRVNQCK